MSGLRISGVTKAFGATPVLKDISLDVPSGLTAVLGSSGCGKTTLLRLVAGFLSPDSGTITIGGQTVAGHGKSLAPKDRRVGYVPQEGALFPHLDVAANIAFGLSRSQRRGTRVKQVLDLVELSSAVARRHPHELSGGQQQRVALARALAPEPALVLLDEPFSSLDAGLREDTGRAVARALRAGGATAVLVTHDQTEALSLADTVAVMVQGQFVQVSEPAKVYLNPATSAIAAFVGNTNLLPGTASGATAHCVLGDVSVSGVHHGPIRLSVRPEQVKLSQDANSVAPDFGVVAKVQDVSFYGHDTMIRVLCDAPPIIGTPEIAHQALSVRVSTGPVPAIGATVRLHVEGPVLAFGDSEEPWAVTEIA